MSWDTERVFSFPIDLVLRCHIVSAEDHSEIRDGVYPIWSEARLEVDEVVYAEPSCNIAPMNIKQIVGLYIHGAEVGDDVLAFVELLDEWQKIFNYGPGCRVLKLPGPADVEEKEIEILLEAIRSGHAWNLKLASKREMEVIEAIGSWAENEFLSQETR